MQNLTFWDFILAPVFFLVFAAWGTSIRNRWYPQGHPLRRYYMPGLYFKLAGAVFIGLIYEFYYGGGDTLNYFYHVRIINSALDDSIVSWWKLLANASPYSNPEIYSYVQQMYWYNSVSEYAVSRIAAILGLFSGTTYLPIALTFAFLSYSGIWALFRTFVNMYPKYHRNLSYAILFIPSVVVWGSGLFKDTICMFGLGWMTYTTFRLFINRDLSVKNLLLLTLSFSLIATIKLYILLGFLPALSLWLLMTYSRKLPSAGVRFFVNIVAIAAVIAGFLFFTQFFAEELNKYSLEKLAETAKITQGWTRFAAGDEGSAYDIGTIDGTLTSMLALFPQAVVVTLFRPFLWEAKKVIIAFSAIEATLFIWLTLKVIFRLRSKLLQLLFRDPNMIFCLVFSIIFAFAVGVTSGNFGTLSRYKIPCMPFYGILVAVLLGNSTSTTTQQKVQTKVQKVS